MRPRLAALAVALTPLDPEAIGPGGVAVLGRLHERDPEHAEALTDFYAQRHPLLARVHAIAAASIGAPGEAPAPALYAAPLPEDEGPMLQRFWRDVARLEGRSAVTWVFHDHAEAQVAEVVARSAHLGVVPHADLLLHGDGEGVALDLAAAFRPVPLAEDELAALLAVGPVEPGEARLRFAGSGDPAEAHALAGPLAATVARRILLVEAVRPYLDRGAREALAPFFSTGEVPEEAPAPGALVARGAPF
jgi:hypothetical protein